MTTLALDEYQNDLKQTLDFLRHQLSRAAVDSRHELRQVYLATTGSEYPEVRTVILRSVDWNKNSIIFHTDVRSRKYSELLENLQASVLGYSRKKNYQIRLRGQVLLNHKNEAASQSWKDLSISSRRSYLVSSPGIVLDEAGNGLNEIYNSPDLQMSSTEPGFENFVSVTFIIQEIEWLLLDRQGHRRALFKFDQNQKDPKIQNWICP